ncbi:MAG TPA: hypothetical protein VGI78_05505 [Acetobacteraceae bacterium]
MTRTAPRFGQTATDRDVAELLGVGVVHPGGGQEDCAQRSDDEAAVARSASLDRTPSAAIGV